MNPKDKVILVLGATGQQGNATVSNLLKTGWKVRAFTRDSKGEKAQRLRELGAELFEGDMGDAASLEKAMQEAYGVFSVQPPEWNPTPLTDRKEVDLGILAVDSAKKSGVSHFVYSSVMGSEAQSEFRTHKWEIEKHIQATGIPFTIFRPTGFMENFTLPHSGVPGGILYDTVEKNSPILLVAVEDIGFFVASAFANPEKYLGRTVDLAGDHLTPDQIVGSLSTALSRKIEYVKIPVNAIRERNEILGALVEWIEREGYPKIDLNSLRKDHPGLLSLDAWLRKIGAEAIRSASEQGKTV